MQQRHRRLHVSCVAFVAALVVGCREPPTKEEAAIALNESYVDDVTKAMMQLLEKLPSEAAPSSAQPSGPSVAPAARGQTAGAPAPARAKVEDMKCDRVDRKTFDCMVSWRPPRAPSNITGRYRFVRAEEKWSATELGR